MAVQYPTVTPALLPSATGPIGPPGVPTAYTVADIPESITIKPDWAYSRGPGIRRDCLGALRLFPRTGPVPPLMDHQSAVQGGCALGIYVTDPSPDPPTHVDETWDRVLQVLWPAIHFLCGSMAAGWSIDLSSGIQLLFFEYVVVPGLGNRLPDMSTSMEETLDSLAPPRPEHLPTAIWRDLPATPTAQAFMPYPTITAIPTAISSNGSLVPTTVTQAVPLSTEIPAQVPFLVPYAMPEWTARPPIPLIDCKLAMKSLFLYSWLFYYTGGNFERPYGNTRDRCTVAVYLTEATDLNARVRPGMVNVYHELWQLAIATIYRQGTGGFMDLPNGVQVIIYERSFIDPRNVCAFMNRISLRRCLENRAQVKVKPEPSTQRNRLVSVLAAAV